MKKIEPSQEVLKKLFQLAKKVRKNAHCPYSDFAVGSALIDNKGQFHVGCNFENSSYGGTICAERNAIGTMVASGGTDIAQVLVLTETPNGSPPCGFCRQVLSEFASKPEQTLVHIANTKKILKTYTLAELAPHHFNRNLLIKKK